MTQAMTSPETATVVRSGSSRLVARAMSELVRMVRVAEPGEMELGPFLVRHADTLALRLECDPATLRACANVADETLAPQLASRIKAVSQRASEANAPTRRAAAEKAADDLGAAAVWSWGRAYLDVRQLLGVVLADKSAKFVRFFAAPKIDVTVPRDLLLHLRDLYPRPYSDLMVYVDARFHVRWKAGRGGLNLKNQDVPVYRLGSDVLTVNLRSTRRAPPPPPNHRLARASHYQ